MWTRRKAIARLGQGWAASQCAASLLSAEPWSPSEVIEAPALARRVEEGKAPTLICVAFPVLYRQRHIRGAKYAGPGNKPEGLKELETMAAALRKENEVVLYCGCCPMSACPNIRPSYELLKRLGFTTIRILNIPTNMHTDWYTKGYPSEPPITPNAV